MYSILEAFKNLHLRIKKIKPHARHISFILNMKIYNCILYNTYIVLYVPYILCIIYILYFSTCCWRCISIHPCNKNQLDALFILSLFLQSTFACFGRICSPSSGGILYSINSTIGTCCAFYLIVCWPDWDGTIFYSLHMYKMSIEFFLSIFIIDIW